MNKSKPYLMPGRWMSHPYARVVYQTRARICHRADQPDTLDIRRSQKTNIHRLRKDCGVYKHDNAVLGILYHIYHIRHTNKIVANR